MPIANTVEANIVVNFEDRFSGPACKAFNRFKKCAEAALKALDPDLIALLNRIESGIDNFVNAIDRFARAVDSSVNRLAQKNKEVLTFGKSLESVGRFFRDFWKDLQNLSTAQAVGAIVTITVGLTTLASLASQFPLAAAAIAAGLFLIFAAWDTLKKAKERIELEVKLKDEATARSRLIRKSLESTFRDPIIQEIQVLRRNLDSPAGPLSIMRNPALGDGFIRLKRDAPILNPLFNPTGLNLDPQFGLDPRLSLDLRSDPVPSFASGIRFVPRDMLAQIHKGEAVLPRPQAEQFRQGPIGGITVGNITLNMNGGRGADRNEARRFARMIREELQRTDERMTS
jgi:hypothetical protein